MRVRQTPSSMVVFLSIMYCSPSILAFEHYASLVLSSSIIVCSKEPPRSPGQQDSSGASLELLEGSFIHGP